MTTDGLTPMMQQYHRLKREIPPDAMLLFRLGDFYEMFFGDAEHGSRLLDLTLTQRQGTPMCGMPYHAAEGYIAQLLKRRQRVAICDQMEAPRPGSGGPARDHADPHPRQHPRRWPARAQAKIISALAMRRGQDRSGVSLIST